MTGQLEILSAEDEQKQVNELEDCSEQINRVLTQAYQTLIKRREAAYAAAVGTLDAEIDSLLEEQSAIEEAAQNLEELLPARARVAQQEHDRMLLAGDREGAAAKLAEQREAESAPAAMRTRQQEISNRIEAIVEHKRAVAIRVFKDFYPQAQTVVRAAERGLFLTLLNGLKSSFIEFENRTCPARSLQEVDPMVRGWHIEALTADGGSDLWVAGNRWYGGRGRG